jgi:hypothetical protein
MTFSGFTVLKAMFSWIRMVYAMSLSVLYRQGIGRSCLMKWTLFSLSLHISLDFAIYTLGQCLSLLKSLANLMRYVTSFLVLACLASILFACRTTSPLTKPAHNVAAIMRYSPRPKSFLVLPSLTSLLFASRTTTTAPIAKPVRNIEKIATVMRQSPRPRLWLLTSLI